MIKFIIDKFNNIKYKNQKIKILYFGFSLLCLLLLSGYLFSISYANYQSRAKLKANIDKALYIFNREKMSFNIDSSKIIPSDEAYTYRFSISNFKEDKQSDFNILYSLKIKTTTNMPLTFKLYKNSNLTTNILSSGDILQDVDGSYYKLYTVSEEVLMEYGNKVTNVYTLSVDFPKMYADNLTYSNSIESIEIIIDSSQKV